MLLPPIRTVFRNRWWTLVWAAAICFSAVEFAGGRGGTSGDGNAAAADTSGAAIGDAVNALETP